MKQFQVPAQVGTVSTLKDRTLKLTVYTAKELRPEETALLFDLMDKEGWFMFAETGFQEKDIPTSTPEFKKDKSPSLRLRNTLYVLWEKRIENMKLNESFETWRKNQMERIIEHVKKQIKEEESN